MPAEFGAGATAVVAGGLYAAALYGKSRYKNPLHAGGQTDPELDALLTILVDQGGSIEDCVAAGFDRATAKKVEHLLYISEYKRFQAAPGTRLSKRAFWLDRRYPVVNGWRDPS